MPVQYIVVKERGVRGVNAAKWELYEYTIPDPFDGTIPLPARIDSSVGGDLLVQLFLNGLQQEPTSFSITDTTLTWSHPYLALLPNEVIRIWYVPIV